MSLNRTEAGLKQDFPGSVIRAYESLNRTEAGLKLTQQSNFFILFKV